MNGKRILVFAAGALAAAALAAYTMLSRVSAVDGGSPSQAGGAAELSYRPPAQAGRFYPADPDVLRASVDRYVGEAQPAASGRVIAVVAPHAGYEYSGDVAGKGFALLRNASVGRVIVLAVSHGGGPVPFWADDVDAYRTPIGDVPVDRDALAKLKAAGMPLIAGLAPNEHSLEVELPFLERVLAKGWKLVPILAADAGEKDIARAAASIKGILDDSTIVCVSSDFTHYGAAYGYVPFKGTDDEIRGKLAALDGEAVKLILAKDGTGFARYLARTGATICGQKGLLTLLALLPEWAKGRQTAYAMSGDKTKSFNMSVSYVSAVFTVEGRNVDFWGTKAGGEKEMASAGSLTDSEKKTLLTLARASLEAAVGGTRRPDAAGSELTDALKEKRGAFVTLTIDDQLRGCIGYVLAEKPLYQSVMENAVNAALSDPRFPPVKASELKKIKIEISAMSPLETIADVSKIEVGKHGIIISRGWSHGLLLPQVATEWGWDREEFLAQTCRKAGLPSDAWKDPSAKIQIFSAEVFHEGE